MSIENDTPVPSIWTYDRLIVRYLCSVNHSSTGAFDESDKPDQRCLLLFACQCPEALPWQSESGVLERAASGQELAISIGRCFALLRRCIIITGINTIDCVKNMDCVSNSSGKCANGILVNAFRYDTASVSHTDHPGTRKDSYYPARDVKPTVGLMPTKAFLSAGLMTIKCNTINGRAPCTGLGACTNHFHPSQSPEQMNTDSRLQHQHSQSCYHQG